MLRALAPRLLFALALVVLAFVGVFVLVAVAPGAALPDTDGLATTAALAAERARLGLDQPVLTRLGTRLARLAWLDLGTSTLFGRPVRALVAERAASTLHAGGAALLLALLVGIPAGVLAIRTRHAFLRRAIAGTSVLLLSLPALVVALMLAAFASGAGLSAFAVMVVALALPAAALLERLQASAMRAVLDEPCLAAARARGVPERSITWKHAWPLSLPAVLGAAGVIASHLLSGALAIEVVTARTGLGRLTFDALVARDIDLAAGCAAAAALLVGMATVAADAVQLCLDPRLADETTRPREARS
jgi:peptide/nickel transport system permease protein